MIDAERVSRLTAATRVYALLGDPVAHSLSPIFQNAAFAAAGRDAAYVALRCERDAVAPLMRTLARAGGGGNVTVPHKAVAAAAVDMPSDAVRRTGACNTFWWRAGRLCGENTDVAGFAAAATSLIGGVSGRRVLLLGAGGAAAAALCALVDGGAACVEVRNRSASRAAALRSRFRDAGTRIEISPPGDEVAGFDLVVNATSLGLDAADPHPIALRADLPPLLDLVYRPGGTAWVRAARDLGVPAADGLGMLLAQGAAAYACWFGEPPPPDAMAAAVAPAT